MNIFKVLASGKHRFREEFVSAFLAYLLSPHMDHGPGSAVLATMLEEIARANDNPSLASLASNINDPFQVSLFSSEMATGLETEFRVPTAAGRIEFIDILVRRDKWLFLIENKIDAASKTKGQLLRQFQGLEVTIEKEKNTDMSIGGIYLVPAARGSEGWSVMESALEEVSLQAGLLN